MLFTSQIILRPGLLNTRTYQIDFVFSNFFVSSHRAKRRARQVAGPIFVTPPCAWVQNCMQENLDETLMKAFAQCLLLLCYHDSRKVAVWIY